MSYESVAGRNISERIVERSRFITYVAHTEGEEEARAFLAEVRALHPLATHVCFGYIADKVGNEQRFSDDGEPQGTAGMPILNVIKAQKLYEVTVAVVRYFGGIKLGAGGLVRAYSTSAAEGIASAQRRVYDRCTECSVSVDYSQIDSSLRFFASENLEVLSQEYDAKVSYVVAVRESEVASFTAKITDYLNGKVDVKQLKTYFYPFPLDNE